MRKRLDVQFRRNPPMCRTILSAHGEGVNKKMKTMICENRGIARKTRDLVAEFSLPCAITSATDPGKIRTV